MIYYQFFLIKKNDKKLSKNLFNIYIYQMDDMFAPMVLHKQVKEKKIVHNLPDGMKKVCDELTGKFELVKAKIDPDFGKQMVSARQVKRISQKELATATSISLATISDYEKCIGNKNQTHINKIKKYLNL